jgi:trimeric autotransporter adhesin
VAVDVSGNIYIADTANSRVRVVAASNGKIATYAGSSTSGYAGDTDVATSAKLSSPYGLVLDSSGNLYIADSDNHAVRLVTLTGGIISTVAGTGAAGNTGDNGDADTSNNKIRVVASGTGKISTVVGVGTAGYSGDGAYATSAELRGPYGVAIDNIGNIFIADSGNNVIRKVSILTNAIETFAGTGVAGYDGDGGIASIATMSNPRGVFIDSSGNLYVAEYGNMIIRQIVVSTGYTTTYAGTGSGGTLGDGGYATSAQLKNPTGVTVDASGSLYIADSGNNKIRMVFEADTPTSAPTHTPSAQPTGKATFAPSGPSYAPTLRPTIAAQVSTSRS